MDWQEGVYSPTNEDNRVFKNIQNSRQNYKLLYEYHWKLEGETVGSQTIAEEKIQGGIFQEDSLSSQQFVIAMMQLNHVFRKCTKGYEFLKLQEKLKTLIQMDDIKEFTKERGKKIETLMQIIMIYSQNVGMEFGIEKCATRIMKSGERETVEGKEIASQESFRTVREKENDMYLRILRADTIKQAELKEKSKKKVSWKLFETKLRYYQRDQHLIGYSGLFLKWTPEEIRQMDKKLMTRHLALQPRDVIDRLYESRKEGGRGLTNMKDFVDASKKVLEDYIKKNKERLITWRLQ